MKEPEILEPWWMNASAAQPYVFGLLIATGLLLEIVIHYYYSIAVVYTQFFYLIVVIAGLWYGKKAIWVAVLFGSLQVIVAYLITDTITPDSLMRGGMLCIVGVVVGTIIEQMNVYRSELHSQLAEAATSEQAYKTANKKLNLLSGITRHDIQNQLTVLVGYLELSKEEIKDPVLREYLDHELQAADTISRQIAFTKLYEEIGVHAPYWQNVSDMITQVIALHSTGISFHVDVGDLEIYADPMLEKIFLNLIDNSVRHGEHVSGARFYSEPWDGGLKLVYEDNGTGILFADKERIFEKGYGKNTGFGLFLTREILAITGLTIIETGIFGKGVRFEIMISPGRFRFGRESNNHS